MVMRNKNKVTKKKRKRTVLKKTRHKEEDVLVDQLGELAERLGVKIRCEPIRQEEDSVKVVGGLCLLKGEYVLIIDTKATTVDKINTLAEAVSHFDLDRIHVKPVLRELLNELPERRSFIPKGMRRS